RIINRCPVYTSTLRLDYVARNPTNTTRLEETTTYETIHRDYLQIGDRYNMFSLPKLPTQLPNAFGLLGDDAKLTFRTSPNGIRRLAEEKNIPPSDETYWSQYITLFDSASDVFTLISPNDGVYRPTAPVNLASNGHF
ncbi:14711_t:CDS:2, partial [Acaulospora colombiana]